MVRLWILYILISSTLFWCGVQVQVEGGVHPCSRPHKNHPKKSGALIHSASLKVIRMEVQPSPRLINTFPAKANCHLALPVTIEWECQLSFLWSSLKAGAGMKCFSRIISPLPVLLMPGWGAGCSFSSLLWWQGGRSGCPEDKWLVLSPSLLMLPVDGDRLSLGLIPTNTTWAQKLGQRNGCIAACFHQLWKFNSPLGPTNTVLVRKFEHCSLLPPDSGWKTSSSLSPTQTARVRGSVFPLVFEWSRGHAVKRFCILLRSSFQVLLAGGADFSWFVMVFVCSCFQF